MYDIFILQHRSDLTRYQLVRLEELKLKDIYSTLTLFVKWIENGLYDFHRVPYVLKEDLSAPALKELQKICDNYQGARIAKTGTWLWVLLEL